MKNRIFLFVVALFSSIGRIVAQDVPIQVNNQLYNLNFGDVPSFCIPMTDTIDILIDNVWAKENGVKNQSWELRGDMSFAPGYSSGSYPLTRIVSSSDGYAKGRITYKYKTTGCSSAVSIDLYKIFAPPADLEIKGPECIVDSQEVVYSVDPILTKNLDDQIGIDTYTWNIIENPNLPFVDTILYVSGDGSSVTFRAKNVNPQNPPVISVSVGRCNGWYISKQLGNATPKPDLPDTLFVPVGVPSFKVGVRNPKQNIDYTWECKPASSFGIEQYGANGDSALVTIKSDANKAECRIILSATYKDIQCNISADTMYVVRTWGNNVEIRDSTKVADSCYSVKTEEDTPYMFTVEGSSSIPTETECNWILPYGWNFKGGRQTTGTTVEIYPTAAAHLVDTLILKPLDARDHAKPDSFPVHVRPVPVPVSRIMQNSCLKYNETGIVYIDTTGMNMPAGVWFEWSAPHAEMLSALGTDTLRFIPSMQTNTVSVTSKGINSCDAASTEYTLIFEPQKPDSIIWEDSACVSFNMPDTLTFTIANALSGQKYEWTKPAGWSWGDTISSPKDLAVTIELISNGVAKTDTIYAKGVNKDNSDCPFSDSVVFYITTDSLPAHIQYLGRKGSKTRYLVDYGWDVWEEGDPDPLCYPEEVCWYLFNNGQPNNEAILNGRYSEMVELARSFADILNSTQYTLVVDVKFDNGCKTRVQYGATLDLDTVNLQRSAPLLQRTSENFVIPKLTVKPNPSQNTAKINLTNSHLETADLYVYTMGGHLIKSQNKYMLNSDFDVSMLPPGKYILVLKNGEDEYVQHLFKSR